MSRSHSRPWGGAALAVSLLVILSHSAQAQTVTVTGEFASIMGGFIYSVFVNYANPGDPMDTLAVVDITAPPQSGSVSGLIAPLGFIADFDPGVGSLVFAEDFDPGTPQKFFAGTSQGPFFFRSTENLNGAAFTALDSTNVFSGTLDLTANPNLTIAPEPGTFALLVPGLLGGTYFLAARRRREK